jgi:Protein of unknown function (DUF1360)
MAATETPGQASAAGQSATRRDSSRARPFGAYATLSAIYAALSGGFAAWLWRSGRTLSQRPDTRDLLLIATATHKLSRLIAKDRVTSVVRHPFTEFQGDAGPGEVEEAARGTGLRRALGELLICPYCLGLWIASALTGGLIVVPRATRWTASVFCALFASDVLQVAYKKLTDEL